MSTRRASALSFRARCHGGRRVPGELLTPDHLASAPARSNVTLLDAEKLDVYRLAVEFQALAARLIPCERGVLLAALRDQLDRASISIVLNIAEGAGRFSAPDKARFYAIARGSATECGAVLDLLVVRGVVVEPRCREARALIVRIVQMLTRLRANTADRELPP